MVNHRIKIGTSINSLDRLGELQTDSSMPLSLMAMCGGGRKTEREFHETWGDRRIAGEWFNDNDREITRCVLSAFCRSGIVWPEK